MGPVEAAILEELSPTFRDRTVEVAGGSLRVMEGGEGPPLVLLHGRGSAAPIWFPLLPELARSFRVYLADLPGFGSSRGYCFSGGNAEEGLGFFTDPILAWLEGERLASPRIVGHSLGGFVTLELALRKRLSPHSLVVIGSMGLGPELTTGARLFFRAGPERIARALGPALFEKLLPPSKTAHGERLGRLGYELYAVADGRVDAARAFDTLVPLRGPAPHKRERLAEIDVPALVLFGEEDEVVPSPMAIGGAGAMPEGRLRIEAGAGHSLHLDQPERILSILLEFLRR